MKSKTDRRNERRGGFYWIDDKPYPSVTNILKVLDKPALRYWFGKEVYYAMVKDPTLDEKAALSAPYQLTEKAKERGSTIHSIVEAWEHTKIDSVPEEYRGYANAFFTWIKDYKMKLIEHEKTIVSKSYGYAGTLDLLTRNNGDIWIIDVKTGKDIYDEAHLQVSAYKHAINEKGDLDKQANRGGVLLLQSTGTYKFEETPDCFEYYLAAKKLWEFQNKDLLNKVGYIIS